MKSLSRQNSSSLFLNGGQANMDLEDSVLTQTQQPKRMPLLKPGYRSLLKTTLTSSKVW